MKLRPLLQAMFIFHPPMYHYHYLFTSSVTSSTKHISLKANTLRFVSLSFSPPLNAHFFMKKFRDVFVRIEIVNYIYGIEFKCLNRMLV